VHGDLGQGRTPPLLGSRDGAPGTEAQRSRRAESGADQEAHRYQARGAPVQGRPTASGLPMAGSEPVLHREKRYR